MENATKQHLREKVRMAIDPPYRCLDLFSVAPSSTPRLRCVNSQLVSLPPVGILNFEIFVCLFAVSLVCTFNSAKYIWHLNKVIIINNIIIIIVIIIVIILVVLLIVMQFLFERMPLLFFVIVNFVSCLFASSA